MRVLLAEDNVSLARATEVILTRSGFEVEVAHDGGEALELFNNGYFDVGVLDIMMPVMDGLEVLRRVRAEGNTTPVILLTAKAQVDDRIQGLDLGADDYMSKPFDARELIARIRAAARPRSGAAATISFGDLTIEADAVRLTTARGSLRVDPYEVSLVAALANAGGSAVGTEWLRGRVWGEKAIEGVVPLYAKLLNGKLEALGSTVRVEGSDEEGWRLVRPDGDGASS